VRGRLLLARSRFLLARGRLLLERGRSLLLLALALSLVTAGGCAASRVGRPVVWPDPPETPRIRFVTAFRGTVDLDNSTWAKLRRGVFGGETDPNLAQPMGLAISDDGRRLYVADHGLGQVMIADLADRKLTRFAADEPQGKPFAVALDAKENVYVSDSAGRQVIVFSRGGERLRAFGARELERPTGIAVDRARGLVYVADSATRLSDMHRVLVYDLAGKLVRQLGGAKGSGDGEFYFPTYIALAPDGRVFVADTMNFRVQEFDPSGKFLRKFGENGDTVGTFARLKGLALDGFGNLYAVDGGHSNVQIFNRDFTPLMFFGGYAQKLEYFDVPSGIAIDPRTNRIYVCNEFIARINVYELINTTAADSVPAGAQARKAP
jgi:DNA-binding beta-propeller fold protein YncE